MGAAIAKTQPSRSREAEGVGADRDTVFGQDFAERRPTTQGTQADLEQFRRAVVELGLIRAEELERFVAGTPGGYRVWP
jgi:hypothetical protein